jgi:hypothetical protein
MLKAHDIAQDQEYLCLSGYSQLSVVPWLVNGFTPRVGRRW